MGRNTLRVCAERSGGRRHDANFDEQWSYNSESGWSDSTGGFSGLDNGFFSYQSEPSYQTSALAAAGLNFGVPRRLTSHSTPIRIRASGFMTR